MSHENSLLDDLQLFLKFAVILLVALVCVPWAVSHFAPRVAAVISHLWLVWLIATAVSGSVLLGMMYSVGEKLHRLETMESSGLIFPIADPYNMPIAELPLHFRRGADPTAMQTITEMAQDARFADQPIVKSPSSAECRCATVAMVVFIIGVLLLAISVYNLVIWIVHLL